MTWLDVNFDSTKDIHLQKLTDLKTQAGPIMIKAVSPPPQMAFSEE